MSFIKELLIKRFLPFLKWLPELKEGKVLRADFLAGLTVALVLIPQSMAYAQLAGLPPYYGLYAAFLPPMVAALFGSSRQLATGPVAVVSLMTAAALEPLATAGSETFIAYAILLSFIVGLFQLSLGLLRMGILVNFLSHPVVVGFTNAAAIIIVTSQLNKIFGVEVEKMDHHYQTVWNTITAALDHTHWPTFFMAVLAFSIMMGLRRYRPRWPNVLIAVVVTTGLAWGLDYQKLHWITNEQVVSESVKQNIEKQLRLRQHLVTLDQEITEAQEIYKDMIVQFGAYDLSALQARFIVENLKLQRDAMKNDIKQLFKQLQAKTLYFVPEPNSEVTYPLADKQVRHQAGSVYLTNEMNPSESTLTVWKVKQLDAQGNLLLHSGGAVVGTVPSGLPSFQWPHFDLGVILQLISAAIVISLIGFMEAISIAKAMAERTRQRLDANQELIGQGLANIAGSLFQSYPTSGSFSRSAVNIGAGAVTGFSAVITSIVVVMTLWWFTPLLYNLPQATLAAVIMIAVVSLINVKAVEHAWHANKHDGSVAIITFVLTLVFAPHLDLGILAGVALSLGLFLYRRMEPRVVFLQRNDSSGELENLGQLKEANKENDVGILRFEGSLYFASVNYFEEKVQELLVKLPKMRYLVVEAVSINEVDASGEEMLRAVVSSLKQAGVEVLFNRVKAPIKDMLGRTGFVAWHGEEKFFRHPIALYDYITAQQSQGRVDS
ncbi:SulP family inorganic anion transporter [Thioflexithrix psekupsensis]|uniref:STAS domain-containing protein n=1 Tax=Thioflexithrix psekupsensis TaxID=1570016 RepID=A0A251XAL3_9GAMM|nr:SulP family inorganic anion transporter [Thioflexithrix psekupsensis]OUD15343.1 hypothetical protein TPSD3_02095 [Thioflexithrix psekupsensis]